MITNYGIRGQERKKILQDRKKPDYTDSQPMNDVTEESNGR